MKLLRNVSLALAMSAGLGGLVLADTAPAKTPAKPAPAKDAKKEAPAKDAPAKDAGTPTDADLAKFLAFFDKLVDIAVTDKDDCTKMAGELNKHIDDNKALLDKAKDAQKKGMKLPDTAKNHMMEKTKILVGAMQKCGNDKGVQDALMKMK